MDEEVIINIDVEKTLTRLAEVNKALSDIKKSNNELNQQLEKGTITQGAYNQAMADNTKQSQLLKGEQKALTSALQTQTQATASLGDSYYELNARLLQLQKEYKGLTKAQRDSAQGQELLKSIQDTKQALKDMDATMGDYQRNVGNYAGSLSPLFGKLDGTLQKFGTSLEDIGTRGFKAMQDGFANLGKSAVSFGKVLLTTPLGWLLAIVGAIVAILHKLAEAFRKNDDAGTDLAVAMSTLKPITTLISKIFDGLAVILGKVALGIASVIKGIGSLIPGFEEAAEAAQQLTKAEDELQEKERKYTTESAERNKQIAELRANAVDKEKYTAKEREAFLQQAIELEKKNLEQEKNIKAERLRILQEKAKQEVDTSDATKDAIAKAQADLYASETNYFNRSKELQSQLLTARKENTDEEKRLIDERIAKEKEASEEEKRIQAERLATMVELSKALEDAILANMQEGTEKQIAEENIRYERELQDLEEKYGKDVTLKEQYDLLLQEKEKEHLATMDAIYEEQTAKELENETAKAEMLRALKDEINAGDFEYEQEQERLRFDAEMQTLRDEWKKKGEVTQEEQNNFESLLAERQAQFDAQRLQKQLEYEEKAKKQRIANATTQMQAFGNVLGSIGSLIEAFDDQSEESAKASKAIALGRIAIETGIAIAQGISTATRSSATWIDQLVAIATTVTTVVANMATAISTVKSAKFAEGGIVEGTSYAGDKVPARVNSGEMILTRQQQSTLFDIANGRTQAGGLDYEALAVAMANTPAPILDYQEFNTFKGKVVQYDELAKL